MGFLGSLAIPCIICFVVAVVLYVIEMFLPGFGIAGILGSCCFVAVIVMQFAGNSVANALLVSAIMLVLIAAALLVFIRSFQKGKLSKSKIVLNEHINTSSSPVAGQELSSLVGRTCVSVTPLRPSGIAEIDGKRINVETYGNFVSAGTEVVIVQVEGLNVFVK